MPGGLKIEKKKQKLTNKQTTKQKNEKFVHNGLRNYGK